MGFKPSVGIKGPKCAKKIALPYQAEPLIEVRMDPCFDIVYTNFWPHYLNAAAEMLRTGSVFQSSIAPFC